MLKELTQRISEMDALRQCKWRNIFFSKNGKSYRGGKLFETRNEAEARANNVAAKCRGLVPNSSPEFTGWKFQTADGELEDKDYAWHMQMPVSEAA